VVNDRQIESCCCHVLGVFKQVYVYVAINIEVYSIIINVLSAGDAVCSVASWQDMEVNWVRLEIES